jgi:DNA-binding IclR family transcriptional regulator
MGRIGSRAARTLGMAAGKEGDKNFVRVAEKVFLVIEAFGRCGHSPVTLEEVTQLTGLAKNTVHRLLYTLQKIGYIDKHPETGKYLLSLKFYELGKDTLPYQRLTVLAKPFMNALMLRFGESIHIGVLENGLVTNIAVCESQNPYRIAVVLGDSNHAHCTAMGKCLLAYLPEQELEAIVRTHGLPKKTSATITTRAVLLNELEKVRQEQVATNVGETIEGVICVGAPIFNHDGKAVAAISLSGPAIRMEPTMETVKKEMRSVGRRLSTLLGYNPSESKHAIQAAS